MKKYYIQSIGVFAIALPLIAALILTGFITLAKSKLLGDYSQNKNIYKTEQTQIVVLEKLKVQQTQKQEQLEQWNQLLIGDSFTKVNNQLRQSISNNNITKTLQLTDQKRASRPAFAVDAPRSSCEFVLEGTFTEIQRCMTELECELPNLMVNSMTINSKRNSKLLNLKLNYTIWEKAQ